MTTVKLDFAKGPVFARFSWQDGRIVPNSEDLMLPSLAGPLRISPVPYGAWQPFWYPSDEALFTFDLLTGKLIQARTLVQDGKVVELAFERPGGATSRWTRSDAPSQH